LKETQARHRLEIEQCFAPLPVLEAPLFQDEIVGLERLREMADALYGADDPSRVYWRGRGQRVEKADGGYLLRLPLPFTEKRDVELTKLGDELLVLVGQHRRKIILPRILVGLEPAGARFDGDELLVSFAR
jgi:arsenite-transporting ATPase